MVDFNLSFTIFALFFFNEIKTFYKMPFLLLWSLVGQLLSLRNFH